MADEDDTKDHFNLKDILKKESGKGKKHKKWKRKQESEIKSQDDFRVNFHVFCLHFVFILYFIYKVIFKKNSTISEFLFWKN